VKKQLLKYLDDPFDFNEGVELFGFYFPEDKLLISLKNGYTIIGEEKMHAMLFEKSFDRENLSEVFEPVVQNTNQIVDVLIDKPKIVNNEAEEVIKTLKMDKSRLFAQAAAAHMELARLKLAQKDKFIRCKLIIENFELIDDIWLTIDYYGAYGVLPNKFTYASDYEKALKDSKKINNLRTYISKLERDIPLLKSAIKIAEKNEKLNGFKFELKELLNGV